MEGKKEWADLFAPSNFFQRYRHFIVIIAQAADVVRANICVQVIY